MGILQRFKLVVRENDFVEVRRSKDGTAAWFSNTNASMRLCIDGLTNSATVFWTTGRETQFENVSHRSLIERMVRPTEGASAPNNGTTDISCDAVVTTQRLKQGY
jgi:hypothetical protein